MTTKLVNASRLNEPIVPPDSVWVIKQGEQVPNAAEPIGSIQLMDDRQRTSARDKQMMRLAQKTTARYGGNGLAITDGYKPWGQLGWQMTGLMLYLPNKEVDTLRTNSLEELTKRMEIAMRTKRSARIAPANVWELSMGYGFITSKVTDYGSGADVKHMNGLEWKLLYGHTWSSGCGIGIQYSGFRASNGPTYSMMLSYIAPEFLYRVKLNRLIFKLGVGAGLFVFTEEANNYEVYGHRITGSGSQVGGGLHCTFGLEYMMTKQWGLGISMNEVMGILPEPDGIPVDSSEIYGIYRINFMGGIRYYFGK
ncbi:MAG: hypothetical protein LBN24_05650 [Mediterranea sp.]|nr:hypothetical protein [Mediterranea sp.]